MKRSRKQWERAMALAFTSLFGWTFILAPPATALARDPRPVDGSRGKGYRVLSSADMQRIRGAQGIGGGGGGHAISYSAGSGTPFPWEGSIGTTNSGNGNKLTSIPIVSWTQRGGLPVNLSLVHNSQSGHNSELGQKWTHSFDIYMVPASS